MVHAISLIIPRALWDVEKTLQKAKKSLLYIKEISKVKTNKSITERMNRCVMTEIGESVRIDRGGLNIFSIHDMNRLKKT